MNSPQGKTSVMRNLLILGAAALLALAGCSPESGGAGGSDSDQLTVAVIPKGTSHVFWKSVEAGALEAGEDLDVEVLWKGPLKEDNKDDQIKVVEDFITAQVDGITIAPLDENALRNVVMEAQTSGIPVVIFDSGLAEVETTSFVATDNKAAGKLGGEELAKLLNGQGRVLMMRYQEGSASTINREEGFLEAMAENPGIEVVSANQYAGASVESAQSKAETLINQFKSGDDFQVDGIFCSNESATFGMLRALQEAGLAGSVQFVGFDSSESLLGGLEASQIHALVVQDPVRMGYLAVETLVKKLRGEEVDKRIDTGAAVVTLENLQDPKIQSLVNP